MRPFAMWNMKQWFLVVAMLCVAACVASAQNGQRRITPVKPSTNTVLRPAKGTSEEIIQEYIQGDTAAARAKEIKDSLKRVFPRYPLLTDATFGLNFIDPLLMAFGQKFASIDVSAALNLWNRLQPVVELGVGYAKDTPDGMNFTYRNTLSPYVRLGVDYNFLFKKVPDYQLFLGVRAGYSTFTYEVTHALYRQGYWGETGEFELTGLKSHALWGELLAGLRVKLWHNLSMGWQAKYHGVFSYKKNGYSSPWFIPGFGPRNRKFSFSMSIYYTIPLSVRKWPQVEVKENS